MLLGFQALGAVLVTVVSYSTLALINAATFAISALVILKVSSNLYHLLANRPVQMVKKGEKSLWQDLRNQVKFAINES
ncbi:hypothetical protein ACVRY6_11420 [Streptococcus ictaluri]